MLVFPIMVAFVTAALLFWLRSYRLTRKPGVRAMCWALALLDAAVLLGGPITGVLDSDLGIPALGQYLQHVCVLTSAFWLQVFCLHLTRPADETARRTRARAVLLVTALTGLTVFYVLGPVRSGLANVPSSAGDKPWVAQYLAMYGGYLGVAMADTVWMSRLASHVPRRFLRIGLRLLGAGGIAGLLYVVHRVGYSVAASLGITLPWNERGYTGPNTMLVLVAIALLMSGVMVPPLGARWEARKAAAEVDPLWIDVTALAPELVFAHRGDRLRRQITEIRDVLIGPLHPYLDPDAFHRVLNEAIRSGLSKSDAEPVAEAAVIAIAIDAKRRELPALTQTPLIIGGTADPGDDAEGERFVRIARAYVSSPFVTNRSAGAQGTT